MNQCSSHNVERTGPSFSCFTRCFSSFQPGSLGQALPLAADPVTVTVEVASISWITAMDRSRTGSPSGRAVLEVLRRGCRLRSLDGRLRDRCLSYRCLRHRSLRCWCLGWRGCLRWQCRKRIRLGCLLGLLWLRSGGRRVRCWSARGCRSSLRCLSSGGLLCCCGGRRLLSGLCGRRLLRVVGQCLSLQSSLLILCRQQRGSCRCGFCRVFTGRSFGRGSRRRVSGPIRR